MYQNERVIEDEERDIDDDVDEQDDEQDEEQDEEQEEDEQNKEEEFKVKVILCFGLFNIFKCHYFY